MKYEAKFDIIIQIFRALWIFLIASYFQGKISINRKLTSWAISRPLCHSLQNWQPLNESFDHLPSYRTRSPLLVFNLFNCTLLLLGGDKGHTVPYLRGSCRGCFLNTTDLAACKMLSFNPKLVFLIGVSRKLYQI